MAKAKQTLYNILKGKFLVDEGAPKNWYMLVFLAALALIMIASSHGIDKKVQEIAVLNKKMREKRDIFIATRSDLMKLKMESSIIKRLEEKGLFIPENPPQKIVVKAE
ncbi:FtsL-like putative cell division protein [Aureibaculum sp. 2210JD6-5]|uniref:FtsL-like putative cell division protein n=1 Tax=Aureibaculum sp. 2210JD6-5 TaxID=3103957 RepID=UPI002AAF0876|nr:FtsL-like putative cell division protein [Aureibaculum sp. 2210JD6-5]MDY7394530.1 FtsL-like putative cell division protein [Aureibaculum sp. 2210JD6-5]